MSNVDPNERHPDYCPICGKLHKGRFHPMTTDAPPEKMSDAELAAKLLQWEGADEMLPLPRGLLREAARRLAPRVGTVKLWKAARDAAKSIRRVVDEYPETYRRGQAELIAAAQWLESALPKGQEHEG